MSKFGVWVVVGDKVTEPMKGGKGLTLHAWEGHSKKDRDSGEWVNDGTTSYFFNIFDEDLQELASELKPKDRIFVAGRYREKKITEGKGKDATEKWVKNWVVDMLYTHPDDYNDAIEEVRAYLAPEKKTRTEE